MNHYDIDAFERSTRATAAEMGARAMALAETPDDKALVEISNRLYECVILTQLWHMRCHNEVRDPGVVLQAFSDICSTMIWNIVVNHELLPGGDGPGRTASAIMMQVHRRLQENFVNDPANQEGDQRDPASGRISRSVDIAPMQGGRA